MCQTRLFVDRSPSRGGCPRTRQFDSSSSRLMPINGRPYPLRNSTIGILTINNFRRTPKSSALATVDSGQAFEARVLKLLQCLILDDVRRHAKPLPVRVSFILPIHNLNSVMVGDVFVNSGRGIVTPKPPENRYVLKHICMAPCY